MTIAIYPIHDPGLLFPTFSNTNLSNSELWSPRQNPSDLLRCQVLIALTSTPGRAITRCEIWVPITPTKFNTIRRNKSICLPTIITGALQFMVNNRHGGKHRWGDALFSRLRGMCWAAKPTLAQRQLLLFAKGYFGTWLYPESCFENGIVSLRYFPNSIKTVSPCCPCYFQVSLLATCHLYVHPTRPGSQG